MNNICLLCIMLTLGMYQKGALVAQHKSIYKDTTIVGKLIECDSVFQVPNFQYQGIKYFYGVHHLKIVKIDITNSNKTGDTLIIAYVYNKLTDSKMYLKNFELNVGEVYLFYVSPFLPCKSDFPRIQGNCSDDGFYFIPQSDRLIKRYHSINRIIFFTKFTLDK